MPIGATMKDAVSALLDSLFAYRFPAHPMFDQDVTVPRLRLVLGEVQRAALQADQRVYVEDRAVRQAVAALGVPLQLGAASQTYFMLSSHWAEHFARMHAQAGASGPLTVAQLRVWLDEPRAMGLPFEAQNLIVLAFAAQADRTLVRNGAFAQASIERIDGDVELREQPLPNEDAWTRARERAGALFGLAPGEVRKGATVAKLAAEIKAAATEKRPILAALIQALKPRVDAFGVPTAAPRLITLRSAQTLLADVIGADDALATVMAVADAELSTSEAAMGRCLGSAASLRDAVNAMSWDIIMTAAGLGDQRRAAAEGLRARIAEALEADEHAVQLQPALQEAQRRASRLLAETVSPPPRPDPGAQPPQPEPPAPPAPPPGEEVVEEQQTSSLDVAGGAALLEQLRGRLMATPGGRLTLHWRLTQPKAGGGV